MNRRILSCDGLVVASLHIPAFEVKVGDLVCLHMPCMSDSSEANQVIAALLGTVPVSGLQLFGHIIQASPPMQRAGLLGLLNHPRAEAWFRRVTGATREAASAAIARVGNLTDDRVMKLRIGCIPWTARILLGLEAAWALRPDGVIFSTVGQDPLGMLKVYDAVRSHLSECAALYLSYEYLSQGRRDRSCPPGAMCVELRKESPAHLTSFSS